MHLRYTGIFVRDVVATIAFYAKAFGLELRYLHPSNGYAEMNTGATLLAFVGEAFLDNAKLLGGMPIRANRPELEPIGAQLAFVTEDIAHDWQRAVAAGAVMVKEPEAKPWGQTAVYLRDINGYIVELCTPSPRE